MLRNVALLIKNGLYLTSVVHQYTNYIEYLNEVKQRKG